jgi:hypothetical protein
VISLFRETEAKQQHGALQQQNDPLVSASPCNHTTHLAWHYVSPQTTGFHVFPSTTTQLIYARPYVSPQTMRFHVSASLCNHTTHLCKALCPSPDHRFPCFCFLLQPHNSLMQGLKSLPRPQVSMFLLPSATTQLIYARPHVSPQNTGFHVSASLCNHTTRLCKALSLYPDNRFPCFCFTLQPLFNAVFNQHKFTQYIPLLTPVSRLSLSEPRIPCYCFPLQLLYKASCLSPECKFPCFSFPLKTLNIFMQDLVSFSRTSGFHVYASLCKQLNFLCKASRSSPDSRFPCICFPLQTTRPIYA